MARLSTVVATHGHCFDGLASAVLFTRLFMHVHPDDIPAFRYKAMGYGPGQSGVPEGDLDGAVNAILDYRFSPSKKLTWYFDHHVSAFQGGEGDRTAYEARSAEAPRRFFHDAGYGSCTKLIADVGTRDFGLDLGGLESLVRWADVIDSASFPSAEAAVSRNEPVLRLMTVVEHHGGDALVASLAARLAFTPLEEVARAPDIDRMYAPLGAQHAKFVEAVKAKGREVGDVVLVDLSEEVLEGAPKFVTYALWPKSTYSVMVTTSKTKVKISIGYNPWCGTPRRHDIARLCERHGGGGHPVVGAAAFPLEKKGEAVAVAKQLADELAGPGDA